ncbi:hypothetical protein CBL_05733 [Carabus blaptoides fortunei]
MMDVKIYLTALVMLIPSVYCQPGYAASYAPQHTVDYYSHPKYSFNYVVGPVGLKGIQHVYASPLGLERNYGYYGDYDFGAGYYDHPATHYNYY